jgi:REP element-mobilizing transposase RayT
MARLPRNTDPNYIRHISIRTEGASLLLVPDAQVNQIVGGVIARYQELFSVVIYAYTITSNHIHLLVLAPLGNLWRFEQAVNRELAKRINRLRNTRGHFWERRYDEQMVAGEGDALEAFLYTVCNSVSHGLVEHPALWPGLNCYAHVLDEKDRIYAFTDYTAFRKACTRAKHTGERVSIRDFQTQHTLRITPLPEFKHLSAEERRAALLKLIQQRVARIKKERKAQGLGFLGREKILRQRHTAVPRSVKRAPRPICYTKSREAKKRFMEWFFAWLESYRQASKRFRAGEFLVQFPKHCLRPPLHYSLQTA